MHMIRHQAVAQQFIRLAIKVPQRLPYQLRNSRLPQPCWAKLALFQLRIKSPEVPFLFRVNQVGFCEALLSQLTFGLQLLHYFPR